MNKDIMPTEEAIKYYEDESQKMRIRAMCDEDPTIKAGHKKRAAYFKREAEILKQLFGKKYHTVTRDFS